MRYKINLNTFLLIAIVLLGFSIRVYKLSDIPAGFFADEAAIGYNAYSLLKTGKDEFGIPYPFYFKSFGDWRTPIPIYTMIPFIAIFGLNEFSVRFTMVIYGTATILMLYLFTRELFWKKERIKESIALTSSLFLAISPWHIQFSRSGFEFTTMPFYLLVSLFFLLIFLNNNKNNNLIIATFFSIVTFYTAYVVQLTLIPLLFFIFLLFFQTFKNKLKLSAFCLSLFILGLVPFLLATLQGQALTRFNSVSPLFHGKLLAEVLQPMIKTYFDHFSLNFLFLKGDIDMPGHFITRHSVRGMGELYTLQLPLILFGIIYLLLKNKKILLFLLAWFALYPIGSTIVAEGPFAHRSLFGIIPFQIISAIGLIYIVSIPYQLTKIQKLKKIIGGILICVFILIISLQTKDYIYKYFNEYPLYSSDFWGWQYGFRNIMEAFKKNERSYNQLLITHRFNRGEGLLKFYNVTYNCEKCTIMTNPISIDSSKRQLFALRIADIEEAKMLYPHLKFTINNTINLPDGKEEIFIGTFH